MINYEEFWHHDGSAERLLSSPRDYNLNEFDNRRGHQRVSLRTNRQIPLNFACDGVTIDLLSMGWMMLQSICTVNVKDVSLSGIGFLTSEMLQLGSEIYVRFQGITLRCEVCRNQKVHGRLSFYGARWLDKHDEKKQIAFINHIRLKANR
ncbi:PilZ domain-containing protein [Shewanella polaris]|uniref:PilZ domain-containing protein n=1 Tax=Shewanella polaris TaxID=2588449 RepID=A0A4Y5YCG0_9GAMM|nr:PilZ domain-containing protein [Shewanella polaris]QDE30307.1 PilZ domain-containing protein [Shewanella polaris]